MDFMSLLTVSEYEVNGYEDPIGPPRIVRHTSPFYEGVKWAVNWRKNCLGKHGLWEYEPIPSSRDDYFYSMFRFDSVQEALATLLKSTDKDGPKKNAAFHASH